MWYIYGTAGKQRPRCRAAGSHLQDRPCDVERRHRVGQGGGRQIIADRLGADESQALPTVIDIDGRYHMFFCYRQSFDFRSDRDAATASATRTPTTCETGRATTRSPASTSRRRAGTADMQCYPHVFECDGQVYLLYNGNEFGRHGFGAAVLER